MTHWKLCLCVCVYSVGLCLCVHVCVCVRVERKRERSVNCENPLGGVDRTMHTLLVNLEERASPGARAHTCARAHIQSLSWVGHSSLSSLLIICCYQKSLNWTKLEPIVNADLHSCSAILSAFTHSGGSLWSELNLGWYVAWWPVCLQTTFKAWWHFSCRRETLLPKLFYNLTASFCVFSGVFRRDGPRDRETHCSRLTNEKQTTAFLNRNIRKAMKQHRDPLFCLSILRWYWVQTTVA